MTQPDERKRTRRWDDIAALLLVVLVVVGLVIAVYPHQTATTATAPAATRVDRPTPPDAARPTMLVIGDSYVAGTGRDELSYGCMAAARMGWYCKVAASPGTGYISGGPANRFQLKYEGESTSFDERLAGLALKYQPNVVVLDGGRNDLFAPPDAVYNVIVSTIADVQRTWPDATVVFVRPRFLSRPGDDLGYGDELIARLQADPNIRPMLVIADPIASLAGRDTSGLVIDDGIHPTRQGEMVMASALYDSLLALGFTPTK
jgi:lysophospholipase L1-like esterase